MTFMSAAPLDFASVIERIERERQASGISCYRLAELSGISRDWYRALRRQPSRATQKSIAALLDGLRAAKVRPDAGARGPTALLFDMVLAAVCDEFGADLPTVRSIDLRRGATADRQWRHASRMHQVARYIVNTVGNCNQRQISKAAGVSAVAIHHGLKTVEDLLDDPAWGPSIRRLVQRFGGTP